MRGNTETDGKAKGDQTVSSRFGMEFGRYSVRFYAGTPSIPTEVSVVFLSPIKMAE
jgi:hypothetical protein